MNSFFTGRRLPSRWLKAMGTTVFLGSIVTIAPGCGALGAMANPKVAWAVSDPAPMTVVVRRADAAASTAKEVDRLLTATPANGDSDWLGKVGPSNDDASAHMKAMGDHPAYKGSKARVVASEVWMKTLPSLKSTEGKYASLLAAIDQALADQYAAIMAKKKAVADLRAQISSEDDAASAKGVSDADKKAHEAKIVDLKKQADAAEDAIAPMQKDFIASVKTSASKSGADVKDKFGPAFVNLRQAVDDAEVANGAAAVRYPMAMPGIKDALVQHIPVIVVDIIEEKTGKRPTLHGLSPSVALDGLKPTVTLNGLSPSDLGRLSLTDLTAETSKRAVAWTGHVGTLLGDISRTNEVLSFEEKVLDAVLDGFKAGGWKAPAAAAIGGTPGGGAPGGAPGLPAAPKLPGL
jgi:hypothetical protein